MADHAVGPNPSQTATLPSHCFLTISIAGEVQPQSVVVQLDHEHCPITCQSFVAMCATENGRTTPKSPLPTYRGCEFHRIIDNFMVQTGDFERFDGTGGYSPVGMGGTLPDEYLQGKHDQAGIVSMANKGKAHTGGSQFFITLQATPHLNGKHVVFGKVIEGLETVKRIIMVEREGSRPVPLQKVVIVDCGVGKGNRHEPSGGDREEKLKRVRKEKKKREKKGKKHRKRPSSRKRSKKSSPCDSFSTTSSRDDGRGERDRKRKSSRDDGSSISSRSSKDSSSYERRRRRKRKAKRKKHHHKQEKRR